jgi:GTPase SAR1 family protein
MADHHVLNAVALLERLESEGAEFELPEPAEEFGRVREKLADATYNVLVVGEAKRGKSTFVNALIGRDILPTDVDIATSQVFRVSRGPEGYRLRFEDGSEREIQAAELSSYGSQVVLDAHGQPWLEQTVRWIEVDVPARFLPDNISILDTPGLGALYRAHAEVTYRFVPRADAVIFMLDSGQPIVQAELDLLRRILKVTRSVFFVQSKIDQHGAEHWDEIRARSEALLGEHLGDQLADVRIWPVSSNNLQKAATSSHPDALMKVSRYKALAEALSEFLQQMSGNLRIAQARGVAGRYHAASRRVLASRLEALEHSSQRELAEDARALSNRRASFEADWGPDGHKRAQLVYETKRIVAINKQAFRESLQIAGPVAGPIDQRIGAVENLEEANALGEVFSDELIAAALEEWTKVRQNTEGRIKRVLTSFMEEADSLSVPATPEKSAVQVSERKLEKQEVDVLESMAGVYASLMAPVGMATLLGIGLGPFGLMAGLLCAAAAWNKMEKQRLTAAKNELRQVFHVRLQELQQHFFGVDVTEQRFSLVDEYFTAAERAVVEYVDATTTRTLGESDAEAARLREQATLRAEERMKEAGTVRDQLATWDRLGEDLAALATGDRPLAVATSR